MHDSCSSPRSGAFFGSCFAPSGTCTKDANGEVCWKNGDAPVTIDGGVQAIAAGAACYTLVTSSDAKTYTFAAGGRTLVIAYEGNQARVTCADGSQINYTAAAFNNSACALYVPPSDCTTGSCP